MDDSFKATHERRMAETLACTLPPPQRELWTELRHVGRMFVHGDSKIVLRLTENDRSNIVDTLTLGTLGISFDSGLEVELTNSAGRKQIVTHYPKQLFDEPIFIWIPPFYPDVRYLKTRQGYQLSINIAYRCAHRPEFLRHGNKFLNKL